MVDDGFATAETAVLLPVLVLLLVLGGTLARARIGRGATAGTSLR